MSTEAQHKESFYCYFLKDYQYIVLPQIPGIANLWFLFIQTVSVIDSMSWSGPQLKSGIIWLFIQVLCHNFLNKDRLQIKGFMVVLAFMFLYFDSLQSTFLHQRHQNMRMKLIWQLNRRKRVPRADTRARSPLILTVRRSTAMLIQQQLYMQRICRPLQALCCYFRLCEFICIWFSCFRGLCSPGVLYSLYLFHCFSLLFLEILWSQRGRI